MRVNGRGVIEGVRMKQGTAFAIEPKGGQYTVAGTEGIETDEQGVGKCVDTRNGPMSLDMFQTQL